MKIGILTFHSQLNYGGVLQCWALKTALENMGHEVVVIDRIFGQPVRSYWHSFAGVGRRGLIALLPRLLARDPRAYRVIRAFRTIKFFKENIKLSKYSFSVWRQLKKRNLGIDCMVVGSDQVWNCEWQDPGPYLLEGAPRIPAITYGVSLGMTNITNDYIPRFREAERRFTAISVREEEAKLLLMKIGIKSTHVVDPVFLCSKTLWEGLACHNVEQSVVCYFIDPSYQSNETLSRCEALSKEYNLPVYVFVNHATNWRCISNRVHYCFGAGPVEFLSSIKTSKCIITDSFHALAFGIIFGKRVIVDKPRSTERVAMFSRISELLQLEPELRMNHMLESKIASSRTWLASSLAKSQCFQKMKSAGI